jgi:biopolymer transport protein ExbB
MKTRWMKLVFAATAVIGGLQALPVYAQETVKAAESTATIGGIPFDIVMNIAIKSVYGLLAVLSVLTLAMILYLLAVLRKGQIVPEPLRSELVEKLRAGDIEDARRLCGFRRGPLSAVLLTALDHMKSMPDIDPMLLRDVVEGEGSRQSESIQGQTQYLMDIAVVAPMIGLLGTVFGMMIAFNAVSDQIAVVRPTALIAGVNKAMITTAFGLVVGIPAMMAHAYFRNRTAKLVSLLETASAELFTTLLSRR